MTAENKWQAIVSRIRTAHRKLECTRSMMAIPGIGRDRLAVSAVVVLVPISGRSWRRARGHAHGSGAD